jgi:hypothetical protein
MPRNLDLGNRLFAVALVMLFSFFVGQSARCQSPVSGATSETNWSCLERKDLLRDQKGHPVWLTSEELMHRVIERASIERPGPLGKNELEGVVSIRILINKHGKVICAQGIDGHPLAISAAMRSLREWTFKPFTLNRKRKAVVGILNLRYDFG